MRDMDGRDEWVVEVEKCLEEEIETNISPEDQDTALIYDVPDSMLSSDTEEFYHPQVLCLGPYHFRKVYCRREKIESVTKDGHAEKVLQMESLKSKVATYVHHKIKNGPESRKQSEIKERNKEDDEISEVKKEQEGDVKNESGFKPAVKSFKEKEEKEKKKDYVKNEGGLKWVVERFMEKEKEERIKKSYANKDKFWFTGEVCAWMIARDACFVIQVLEMFGDVNEDEDAHSIVGLHLHNPELTNIMKDVLKMENQLPFWALKEIRLDIEDWFESALKNLSPVKVKDKVKERQYKPEDKSESHILQLLHDYIVDSHSQPPRKSLDCSTLLLCCCFFPFVSCFGLKRDSPSTPCSRVWACIKWLLKVLVFGIPLLVLSPVVCIIIATGIDRSDIWWKTREHVPTADELKSVGVKFKKLQGEKKGISHTEFKCSTLYLPQFKVDNSSEVILRNLIALEICSPEKEKPITRYAILMNDLINTKEDVAILRGEDIIINKLGNDEDIAKLWNSMVISTKMPSFKPIDDAVLSIDKYRKSNWKVLWTQFVMIHCSKPWLVVSILAGVIVLVLTIVQVVCLFESCQIR